MAKVEIYTKSWCGYSAGAKALLDAKGVPYTDIDITADPDTELAMIERTGAYTLQNRVELSAHVAAAENHMGILEGIVKKAQFGHFDQVFDVGNKVMPGQIIDA